MKSDKFPIDLQENEIIKDIPGYEGIKKQSKTKQSINDKLVIHLRELFSTGKFTYGELSNKFNIPCMTLWQAINKKLIYKGVK